MKSLFFAILIAVLYFSKLSESSEIFRKPKNSARWYSNSKNYIIDDDDVSDDLLTDVNYDHSMFFSKIGVSSKFVIRNMEIPKINQTEEEMEEEAAETEPLNCFGLKDSWASSLESYFKKDEEGSDSLKVFFYGNSRNQTERVVMRYGDLFLLEKMDFDIRRRTIFIVHGFMSYGEDSWILDMEKALLDWGDVNIFVVDWSDGANTWNYYNAAVNTRTVGRRIVTFIGQIIDHIGRFGGPDKHEWGPLHFIGHSLGAHICGYTAHRLKRLGNEWPVQRITGLDPAQPCFKNSHPILRLDRSDAEYVDVIHTNARILRKMGLGLPYPLGHVDFYPNGGGMQPGCFLPASSFWKYIPVPIEQITKTICSHGRSYLYLTESVIAAVTNNCTFWAQEWDMEVSDIEQIITTECQYQGNRNRCMEMGINAEKYNSDGTYFSLTGSSSPYCNVDSKAIKEVKVLMASYKP